MTYTILVIEDEPVLARNVKTYLERSGYEAQTAATAEEGIALAERLAPDLVLLDLKLPGMGGLEALKQLRSRHPEIKIILVTAHGNIQIAVEAMKAGAWDYLSKPVVLSDLRRLVAKAIGEDRLTGALAYYQRREARASALEQMIGEAPAMLALKAQIERLLAAEHAAPDSLPPPVLILGETGSGKEVVARALHFGGPRREQPFVELNCAALPAHLVEDELFGHERGAFTDAKERKLGLVEAAESGTLFLDEIGDIDPAVQVKLLKLLEDRKVRRLGGVREREVDVRFLAATNRPLEALVREGIFRADLYYRVRTVQLQVPPLRARGGDIQLLADHFLRRHCARYRRGPMRFSASARQVLAAHDWPGNVRELSHVLEQAVLLASSEVLEPANLSLSAQIPIAGQSAAFVLPEEGADLESVEQSLVRQALERTGGNVTAAAKLLGLTRDTLRYRIDKHRLRQSSEL